MIIEKLKECFLPHNIECDGGCCTGCWKDVVREVIKMLEQSRQADVGGSLPPIEVEKCYPDLHPTYWTASWKVFPGMVVQADTREEVIDELMTSIRVKLLHDLSLTGGGNDR